MNQAYKLDLNEKERRKLVMQESSLFLMQILLLNSQRILLKAIQLQMHLK